MKKMAVLAVILFAGCATYHVPAPARPSIYLYPVKTQVTAVEKIIVSNITTGFPADMAGIKKDDQIISVEGKTFTVAETFLKCLHDRTQITEFKILRNNAEIIMKAQPRQKVPKFGIGVDYFKSGEQVFPTNLICAEDVASSSKNSTIVDSIFQVRKNSSVQCGMALFGRVLFVDLGVGNQSKETLEFKIDESIHFSSKSGLLFERIPESQVAALANLRPLAVAVNADKYYIPPGTNKEVALYFDVGSLAAENSIPIIARINVSDEQYIFEFDTKRNVSFK